MPSQPEAQGDILKEFREGTFLSSLDRVVSTLAGSGVQGFADGTAAQFSYPTGVAVDSAGTVYVADYNNHRIRKITQ